MNWISNTLRPKIRSILRREVPENLWIKCPETGRPIGKLTICPAKTMAAVMPVSGTTRSAMSSRGL